MARTRAVLVGLALAATALAGAAAHATASEGAPTMQQRAAHADLAVHRGLRTRFRGEVADEDSVRSCLDAVSHGADACEVDVRITHDGVPILMHDATTGRTTRGGRRCNLRVSYYSVRRIRRCRLNHGDRVARLTELGAAMRPYAARKSLVVELKGRAFSGAEISRVDHSLRHYGYGGTHGNLVFESYLRSNVAGVRRTDPPVPAYLISKRALGVDAVEAAGASGLILPYGTLVRALVADPGFVADFRTRGLGVFPWLVDSPTALRNALAHGVTGVMTDNLATIRAALALRRS